VTATDQDEAAEKAAQALAHRIRQFCPESLLADPLAWARDYWRDARTEGWRHIPPGPAAQRAAASPPTEEFLAAKAAITDRKEDHE
jgi:hypothetical protein